MSESNRAARAAAEVARINAFFPIMPLLGNRWAASRPFEGLTIGISAHLTTLTAALARELTLGGGTWVFCSASEATTNQGVVGIKAAADSVDHVADHVVKYRLEGGPSVVLLADGHPLNIVTNSGSPEPVLLHFAVLGLALEWLTTRSLPPGLASIPRSIEEEAAALALRAHDVAHG